MDFIHIFLRQRSEVTTTSRDRDGALKRADISLTFLEFLELLRSFFDTFGTHEWPNGFKSS